MQQLLLDLAPVPAPTLDNFAPGRNAEPLRALRTWLAGRGEPTLYLWGPPGSGKTHLLSGAAAEAQSRGVDARSTSASSWALAAAGRSAPAWMAIDDVHALSPAGQAALFTLLNRAVQGELRLLIAGAIAPAGLTLREDVRTRLGAVLVFQLHPLDDEEKARALQTHARSRGFELPPEAARYLLLHGRRDLRWLLSRARRARSLLAADPPSDHAAAAAGGAAGGAYRSGRRGRRRGPRLPEPSSPSRRPRYRRNHKFHRSPRRHEDTKKSATSEAQGSEDRVAGWSSASSPLCSSASSVVDAVLSRAAS